MAGETAQLTVHNSTQTIRWSTSDPSIAEVSNNAIIFAHKAGIVTITATEQNTGYTDSIEVRVLFTDVAESSKYFFDPVYWAFDNGITTGTSGTKFSPNDNCTRGQVVTFLWRAVGCPEPEGSNPFSDVTEDKFFYKAVLWAYENGITTGTSS
ncbi:MAG: S-layer homology domain-containing protein, partial [Erysipelotrichaceae bacterium]|nr:S-layer homology domain-containing protein [Erysipelotrichaceae bacterium]